MMKKILHVIIVAVPIVALGQHSQDSVVQIDEAFRLVIEDTAAMKRRTIVEVNDQVEIDSIRFYLKGADLKYIYHKTYQSAYSYGEGPPYADVTKFGKF